MHELGRGWRGALMLNVDCLEQTYAMLSTIKTNNVCFSFATRNTLVLTNTLLSARNGGIKSTTATSRDFRQGID